MSRLSDKIYSEDLHTTRFVDNFKRLKLNEAVYPTTEYTAENAKEYRFGISIHTKALITDSPKSDAALQHIYAMKHARELIIEEVFGEFRQPINEIRDALYNRDWKEADELLHKLHRQMFT